MVEVSNAVATIITAAVAGIVILETMSPATTGIHEKRRSLGHREMIIIESMVEEGTTKVAATVVTVDPTRPRPKQVGPVIVIEM